MHHESPYPVSDQIRAKIRPEDGQMFTITPVKTVQCQLCVHNGRETHVGQGVKRKHTDNMKTYTLPFWLEQYR